MKAYEQFSKTLIVLADGLEDGINSTSKNPTLQEQTVAMMCLKITRHTCAAAKLLKQDFYPESIILLRSAYECLVMMKYLQEKPEDLARYEAHGVLCNLRNMLEFLTMIDESDETRSKLNAQVAGLKKAFCSSGIQYYPDLKAADLGNFSKVRKASNKALFNNLPNMLSAITWNDDNDWIKNSFELYNIGSQVAHSQMEWLAIGRFGKDEHPIYSKLAVGRFILMFLNECSETLTQLGISSTNSRKQFENQLSVCLTQFQTWMIEEQQEIDQRNT